MDLVYVGKIVNTHGIKGELRILSDFEKKANVEIEVVLYSNIDDLKSALVSEEVDFAFGNFSYENLNMESTTTNAINDLNYVVLSKNEYLLKSVIKTSSSFLLNVILT